MTKLLNVISNSNSNKEEEKEECNNATTITAANINFTSVQSRSAKAKSKMLRVEKERLVSVYSFQPYRQRPLAAITEHLKNMQKISDNK